MNFSDCCDLTKKVPTYLCIDNTKCNKNVIRDTYFLHSSQSADSESASKNKDHRNLYECYDLTKNVYLTRIHKMCFFYCIQPWSKPTSNGGQEINLGLIVPHSTFKDREYNKAVSQSLAQLQDKRRRLTNFMKTFTFGHSQVHRIMMKVIPSPTGMLYTTYLRHTFFVKSQLS